MTLAELEKRLSKLERRVEQLQQSPSATAESWLASAGQFADDPAFEEIVRLGRQYRHSLRPRNKRARNGRVRH